MQEFVEDISRKKITNPLAMQRDDLSKMVRPHSVSLVRRGKTGEKTRMQQGEVSFCQLKVTYLI